VEAVSRAPGADPERDVRRFASAAQRLADAIAFSDLRARVTSCPGWSAYDLVVHLGNIHAWAATILETGRSAVDQNDEPAHARPRVVAQWYAAKAEDLYQVLRLIDPAQPCWTLTSDHGDAGFWPRRQVHETTVHCLDLDLANGRSTAVDAAVAADGVGEVLEVLLVRMHRKGRPAALTGPVQVIATDTGDSWVVSPAAASDLPPTVERHPRGHWEPGVTDRVDGTAEALYRAMWHRPVADGALRVTGHEARVREFLGSPLTP
jgi:uncharacterized protein (TIGR03083 family)